MPRFAFCVQNNGLFLSPFANISILSVTLTICNNPYNFWFLGRAAGLWMGYYFYSSGTEKDAAPLELALTADGMCYGRGTDSMGKFVLKGSCRELAQGSSNIAYNFAKTCEFV